MIQVVFSRDRAMQLHAFLRSYECHVTPHEDVSVLFVASTDRHRAAYDDVFSRFPWVKPLEQTSFRADLLSCLAASSDTYVIFFADDHLFVRPWCVENSTVNLHLGEHLTWCYTVNVPQRLPPLDVIEPDKLTWWWSNGEYDWGYPLGLCGNVFNVAELTEMLTTLQFISPNTLEAALQAFVPRFAQRYGVCYRRSKLVLLPWNQVQDDCDNRHGGTASVESLLSSWESGLQICIEPLFGVRNNSVHQELPLNLECRRA